MSAIFHFCPLPCVCGYLHFHVNIYLPSITFDIIFSTYSRHIPYRWYNYQTFQRYVYSVSIHFHYCPKSQCTKVGKTCLNQMASGRSPERQQEGWLDFIILLHIKTYLIVLYSMAPNQWMQQVHLLFFWSHRACISCVTCWSYKLTRNTSY